MTPDSTPLIPTAGAGRTVQEYIDETPVWADATPLRHSPITNMQWFIWWLASAGKFFEGMVIFTTGVALPLMAKEFALGATEKGIVAAASLFGILIGATTLGGLADRYGRKQMFIVEMVLFGPKPTPEAIKFELVINLKTAKALGLTISPGVLAIADEVIEWSGASSSRFSAAR